MAGWMKFCELWAATYSADNASFTFMPEIFPGGLVRLREKFTMFVEDVTHNFDRSQGFTTTATLSSLSAQDIPGVVSNQTIGTIEQQILTRNNQATAPGMISAGSNSTGTSIIAPSTGG